MTESEATEAANRHNTEDEAKGVNKRTRWIAQPDPHVPGSWRLGLESRP